MEPDFYEILGKHFRNEITSDEKLHLEKWLLSDENRLIYREVEKVWKLTGRFDNHTNPDIDKEWERFNTLKDNITALSYIENKKSDSWRNFKTWGLRIAAILIVGLAFFAAIKILKPIPSKDILVSVSSQNEIKTVTLPDGSVVTLNKETTIQYPKKFSNINRQIRLTGEAFFEVTKGKGSFTVMAGKTRTVVLGTKFNIKAPADKEYTELYVSEGKVMFTSADNINNDIFIGGEKGLYDNASGRILHEKADDPNKIAWKTGELVFNNYPMEKVQIVLSEYFHKQINIDPEIKNLQFTGSFNYPKLDEILDVLSVSLAIEYKENNDSVFISKPN